MIVTLLDVILSSTVISPAFIVSFLVIISDNLNSTLALPSNDKLLLPTVIVLLLASLVAEATLESVKAFIFGVISTSRVTPEVGFESFVIDVRWLYVPPSALIPTKALMVGKPVPVMSNQIYTRELYINA